MAYRVGAGKPTSSSRLRPIFEHNDITIICETVHQLGTVGDALLFREMGDREEKGERSTYGALARAKFSQSFALMGLDHLIDLFFTASRLKRPDLASAGNRWPFWRDLPPFSGRGRSRQNSRASRIVHIASAEIIQSFAID